VNVLYLIGQQAIRFSGIGGMVIALVGTLYMAYDLFGQRHGPLRILTEAITYVIVGTLVGTAALGVIAFDAVRFDPYFVHAVSEIGAVSVLLAFGSTGGLGAGLGYVLTIERKWNAGQPAYREDRRYVRILLGFALGVFEGMLVYVVMANFRHSHDLNSGIFWGAVQGPPAGLLFGFLVALLQVHFNPQPAVLPDAVQSGPNIRVTLRPRKDSANRQDVTAGHELIVGELVVHVDGDTALASGVEMAEKKTAQRAPFDLIGLCSGMATGVAVGPVTAVSYFALYGQFVPWTFALISLAGIVGGTGLGCVLATAERALLWVDRLPPKRLGTAGVFFVFVGFLIQVTEEAVKVTLTVSH